VVVKLDEIYATGGVRGCVWIREPGVQRRCGGIKRPPGFGASALRPAVKKVAFHRIA